MNILLQFFRMFTSSSTLSCIKNLSPAGALGLRAGRVLTAGAVLLCLLCAPALSGQTHAAAGQEKKSARQAATVYDRQPPVTEKELLSFLDVLPHFRAWAKAGNEEAHPVLRNGKADFMYSPKAAAWVQEQGWNPVRFFCVMGRMAAALAIVEEGNDMTGVRSSDMPEVTEGELALVRRHLGTMLKVSNDAPPIIR